MPERKKSTWKFQIGVYDTKMKSIVKMREYRLQRIALIGVFKFRGIYQVGTIRRDVFENLRSQLGWEATRAHSRFDYRELNTDLDNKMAVIEAIKKLYPLAGIIDHET